jgi:hypothetical protein
MGVNKQAESSNITTFDIYSNYDKKVSVFGGVTELHLYESILDNTVRATAILADTGNRFGTSGVSALERGDIQLTAGEKTDLVVEDNYGQTLKYTGDYHLRIKEVRNIIEHTQKLFFTIDFYSKESIDNELNDTRIVKRYDGKISDSIYKILKKDCLKTPKSVEIDKTLNTLNFIGHVEKPFHKIPWLAKRSVPELDGALGNLAGYFFYEVADNGRGIIGGFKFKSIDNLFKQKPIRKLIFNNTTSIPLAYDAKILDYSFDNTVDLQRQLLSGSYFTTKIKTLDPYTHGYKEDLFNYSNQLKESNIGGLEQISLAKDLDLQNKTIRTFTKIYDTGNLPSGKNAEEQLKRSKEKNFDIDNILRQSAMRYNNLFTTKLSIAIPGDFGLHVGDLVHCDFPEVSDKTNQEVSYRKSGLYMIVDLCHFIRSNPGQTFTRLNLVRESIGRKPF